MQFSLISIVYLIAFSHALLISVVLIKKSEKNQPGILLALMVLVFGYKLFEGGVTNSDLYRYVPHALDWLPGVVLIMGPLFYAYVCRMSGDKSWSVLTWILHLIPAILIIGWVAPQLFVAGEIKVKAIENAKAQMNQGPSQIPTFIIGLLISWKIHLATYLTLSWKKLKKIESNSMDQYSDDSVFAIIWQKRLCLMLMGLELFWIVLFASEQFLGLLALDYVSQYWLLFMASIVLVMGYWGLQQPDLIVRPLSKEAPLENTEHNIPETKVDGRVEDGETEKQVEETSERKAPTAPLVDEVTAKSIAKEIEKQMKDEQRYLKLGLKLTELSEFLGLRSHIVSEVINQTMNTTFFNLINSYRVEHAKKLLDDPNQFRTLEQISVESGFNNRVTFNKAFKTVEGMTPSEYRKTQRLAS